MSPTFGYDIEFGSRKQPAKLEEISTKRLIDNDKNTPYYRHYFKNRRMCEYQLSLPSFIFSLSSTYILISLLSFLYLSPSLGHANFYGEISSNSNSGNSSLGPVLISVELLGMSSSPASSSSSLSPTSDSHHAHLSHGSSSTNLRAAAAASLSLSASDLHSLKARVLIRTKMVCG